MTGLGGFVYVHDSVLHPSEMGHSCRSYHFCACSHYGLAWWVSCKEGNISFGFLCLPGLSSCGSDSGSWNLILCVGTLLLMFLFLSEMQMGTSSEFGAFLDPVADKVSHFWTWTRNLFNGEALCLRDRWWWWAFYFKECFKVVWLTACLCVLEHTQKRCQF